jgi:antitoxin component YwqK of YwqJK toxin-antitoxin module
MKRAILLIAAALLLTSVSAVAQNKTDKQGRRQGHWIRTDKDGSKIYEGDFVDGQETGTFTYYYADGSVRMRNTYTVPGRVCRHETYDEQGHRLTEGVYNQRNRDGLWKFYAADGRLVKEATYSMGIKNGRHVVYERTGDTAEVTTWRNGERNGRWWRRLEGKGYITANYVDGGIEGRLLEYDSEGLIAREGNYKKGLRHGTNDLYEKGQKVVTENWHEGVMSERRLRLLLPEERWVSVYDILCLAPQGKAKVVVYLTDGTKLVTRESADDLYRRLGTDRFVSANRKSRVMVARDNVRGITKDKEGRETLLLEPQPDLVIFPDEDGLKMVQSRQFDDNSPLKNMR